MIAKVMCRLGSNQIKKYMKTLKLSCLTVAAALLTGVNAMALTVGVDKVAGYYGGSGGEFTVTPILSTDYSSLAKATGVYGLGAQTFCLQDNINIIGFIRILK